jgi:hypothetical protein
MIRVSWYTSNRPVVGLCGGKRTIIEPPEGVYAEANNL